MTAPAQPDGAPIRGRYEPAIVGVATILFVVLPFFTQSAGLLRGSRAALVVLLGYAIWRLASGRLIPGIAIAVVGVDFVVQWVLADHVVPGLIFARHVMGLAFIVTAASYLTVAVWRQTAVGVETMRVAVGLYFLIGVFWETVFELTEFLHPNSFAHLCDARPAELECVQASAQYPRMRYFSFVTMTTLGYGDVVPRTAVAEGWVTMASVSGQLFIAILIGKLVGSVMASSQARR